MVKTISGVREFIDRVRITILLFKRNKTKKESFLTHVTKFRSTTPTTVESFNNWVHEYRVSFLYVRDHELTKNSK